MIITPKYFKDKLPKALTMSYDDGPYEDYRLVELFNKYKIKGTFHLNSRYMDRDDYPPQPEKIKMTDAKKLYEGHEISVHTVNHTDLRDVNNLRFLHEVLDDKKALEDIAGYPVRGMSYPYGYYNDEVVQRLRYLDMEYARTTKSHKSFYLPDDFLVWHPTCHHNDATDLISAFDSPRWNMGMNLFYVWGHSYEFERWGDKWYIIEEFCKRISGREDIWYATNIEIKDYVDAVRNLKFTVDTSMVYNPSCTDVWLDVDREPVKVAAGQLTKLK
ncbi:MAG: Polysaccharide deacetylase [Firmicutes bacterium ADurb.Bin099]|jgi:hypothetical protein|nr:MAG: Polysaccharide deacetylase [Firmicutes bacterium ADurb.Bin099]